MLFGSLVISRDQDQYCLETLYFCDFSGGGPDSLSPSGSAHAIHALVEKITR